MAIKKTKKTPPNKPARELAQPKSKDRIGIRFVEAGKEGITEWSGFISEAYNAQLYWPTVQPLYSRLRRSMPEIVMIRQAFTSWARNVKPIIELPDEPSDDDKAYQDFLESDFENMEGSAANHSIFSSPERRAICSACSDGVSFLA